ncbi:hypothetical protein [Streptomonospora nanhaiensis]|uniref:Uncharacterized protein n=1 Tax=Streptomonospora nanhaiensis TaxID=1323731 RepID=A0A853BLA6_9ACTN|nr:hypothetical protein [Streptomonospora nanhaiensis]MBV2361912.1 hypothetical protein [Streptomonospora nanhaiensis]NYI96268.1 hypothetical protein [Streptomonospora nanhaiensis]
MALRGVLVRAAVACAVLAVLAVPAVPAAPAPAHAAGAAGAPGAQRPPHGPVVLIGVPGLRWAEIDPGVTPRLWRLADRSAIGDMSIRSATSRTCPVDGWLTVSAGERALSERRRHFVCELPEPPRREGAGARVPGFAELAAANADSPYSARVGLLGDAVRAAGGETLAVGPGAALAAADARGRVPRYVPDVHALDRADLAGAWLTAVDLDDLADLYLAPPGGGHGADGGAEDGGAAGQTPVPVGGSHRLAALARVDAQVGRVLDLLPPTATVAVAGISVDTGESELNAALLHGPGPDGAGHHGGFLTSESTRRTGLVTLTDVTTTLTRSLELPAPPGAVGRAWSQRERPPELAEAVADLVGFNTAAQVVESLMAGFFSLLVAVQLLIYAAAAVTLKRLGRRDRHTRDAALTLTRVVALGGAAFPVSSYLANLIPWWRAPAPELALPACVLLVDAAVVAAATAGPWRREILAPMTAVAGVTTAVLFVDMCTGANLQLNSPTGYTPIVGGRFYGLGNIAFATFATGMLMTVAGIAHALIARGRRRWAVAAALVIGAATVFVIGWPGLGTDFGGVMALAPGLTVTVLMIAGRRVTTGWLLGVGAAAAALLGLMAYLDYRRPPTERSHFGQFAGQVLQGEAGPVLTRKLDAMLGSLGNWQLTLLAAGALVFLFAVLNSPTNWRMGTLQRAYEHAPMLRAGLTGSLLTAVAGFVVNDSGIAIPALALTVAVPLTLSACTWVLRREGPRGGASAPDRAGAGADAARA